MRQPSSTRSHAGLVETIWAPIQELLKRLGPMAVAILLLVAGFRMPGVAGSASHLALAVLAAHGGDGGKAFWIFALAVGVEGFAYAFASIVLITYMSTIASVEHAASQFGLLTSLCAFPGSILAGFSGFLIEHTASSGSSSGPRSSACRSRCWRSLYGTAWGYRTRRRSRLGEGIRHFIGA
jgi:hypothetical protein